MSIWESAAMGRKVQPAETKKGIDAETKKEEAYAAGTERTELQLKSRDNINGHSIKDSRNT